jgi:cytochrome c oxidase assembly factor 6
MFGFGSSSSSSSSSSSTTPVAGAAPNREERAACWTARDAYFTCLDQNGVIAAGDDKGPCQREKKGYEGSCSRSWVSLFLYFGRDGTGANDRSIISTKDECWR